MEPLRQAVRAYASRNGNCDGVAVSPVPGLMMKYIETHGSELHSISRALICIVLQGSKRITVGREEQTVCAGESFIIGPGMPVVSYALHASVHEPYIAVAIELEISILRQLAAQLAKVDQDSQLRTRARLGEDTQAAIMDCALRLTQLIDSPEAIPILRPGITQELHYWLLRGRHGDSLRSLVNPSGCASRIATAVAVLRTEFRTRVPVERLAAMTGMSLSAFHKHFKHMISMTPGQYQKHLRLIEARRLMLEEGSSASRAAFDVGYESVSQFTREYRRLFHAPPKRDTVRSRFNRAA
jgi:AraC-like DNA-binding protein